MVVANIASLVLIVLVDYRHLLDGARLDPILTALLLVDIDIFCDSAKDGVVLVHVLETDMLLLEPPDSRLPMLLLHRRTVNNCQEDVTSFLYLLLVLDVL